MTANWLNWRGKLVIAIPLALSGATIGSSDRVLAQIVPDGSLGSENSVLTPINPQMDRIDGGAIQGTNLFHSFQEFNIGEGRGAYFANPAGIGAIFSRVTGGKPSQLLGTLGVLGNANLYFINPNGIIFGPNARLDIRGSFVASTASSLIFPNGTQFSATNPNAPPLLTVNVSVPIGLQFEGEQPGVLVNAGNLAVQSGQNLTLVGGTVVSTGQLSAPSGEVAVLAVPGVMADGGKPVVELGQAGHLLSLSSISNPQSSLSHPQTLSELLTGAGSIAGLTVTDNGEVNLTGTDTRIPTDAGTVIASGGVDVSGNTAGRVQVLGDKVGLFGANINASGNNGGGTVLIGGDYKGSGSVLNASRTMVSNDSVIDANALTSGDGGRVIVWADKTTGFYGNISTRGGSNSGNGGFVEVSGKENLIFRGDADVSAYKGSPGTLLLDPENITIVNAPSALDDNQLPTILFGDNPGATYTISNTAVQRQIGNVVLQATNNIIINPDVSLNIPASLNLFPGGSITFTADADNSGVGAFLNRGGTIQTNGRAITISGASVTTGNIDSSYYFPGDRSLPLLAGDIAVSANNDIKTGSLNATGFSSGILRPGNITLISRQGSIDTSMGTLNSSSVSGAGKAGVIALTANSGITTGNILSANLSTSGGDGGQISLTSTNGEINTTAGTLNSGSVSGQGGNITFDAKRDITVNGAIVNSPGAIKGGDITLNSTNGAINATQVFLNSGSVPQRVIDFANNNSSNIPPNLTQFLSGSGNGGAIALRANGDINLTRSGVNSSGGSSGAGGSITLANNGAIALENSLIGNETRSGTGGDINFTGRSVSLANNSVVVSKAFENAQAGNINVNASDVELNQRSYLATQNRGTQPSGNATIETERLSVQGGSIVSTSTDGAGRGGTLTVKASDSVDVAGTALNGVPSILASVGVDQGQAGDVKINTTQLSVRDGGTVSAAALDGSQGGNIIVNADSVIVSGTSANQLPSNLTVDKVDTGDIGSAGKLEINARQLIVRDGGVVSASTFGRGQGGSITVNASEVKLRGASPDGQFKSGIYPRSFALGNAGSVTINTQRLTVEDGASSPPRQLCRVQHRGIVA